ncbi:MAG: class I SAM-dependent methyltransferase [Verrucomicrobiota bacterium]|nr:class I SAM-dependent methyltransferase [Verrucomicrobiota bacterium]
MSIAFNPLDHPILFSSPRRATSYSTWLQHIPFGMLLIELLQPRVVVELGTYAGDSYCAFCQAVETLRLPTKCYGIDTWAGDPHVGSYGNDVLADLRAHHDRLYGRFSQLIRSTFDEAASNFADGSIDLLHIDGCHTYEAVKQDFETWVPKLSPRGVVLFHDTFVRERDFGVWRFWEEVRDSCPSSEFFHGCGLGVLALGREPAPEVLQFLTQPKETWENLRNIFFKLGWSVEREVRLSEAEKENVRLSQLEAERSQYLQAARNLDASRLMKGVRLYRRLKAALQKSIARGNNSAAGLRSF